MGTGTETDVPRGVGTVRDFAKTLEGFVKHDWQSR